MINYWLMKSEPKAFSITDLQKQGFTVWDGVRNYQARNFLRQMQPGDLAFFYHSNAAPSGIVGLMSVVESNVEDHTQFDPNSPYYDPKSSKQSSRWQTVIVQFVSAFPSIISLERLKQEFSDRELAVIKKGNRLSVMPVSEEVADKIIAIADSY